MPEPQQQQPVAARQLHIALIATSPRPGDARYARGLVNGLLQMPEPLRPRLTLIVAPHQAYFSERRQRIRVITVRKDPRSSAGARELAHLARQVAPDVVHCVGLTLPRSRLKAPLVTTPRDLAPLLAPDSPASAPAPASAQRALRKAFARAVKISRSLIVASHQTANDAMLLFPRASGKLAVIPGAADDFFSGERQIMPEIMHRLPPTQFFLAMGSTASHKNQSVLLRAFERFYREAAALSGFDAQACPRLLLVGKNLPGYLEGQLSGPARDFICFTGRATDEELRWLYAHTLAFVFPSRSEGFDLPALEAASFATPVLAARAGCAPEILGEGDTAGAAYFEPDDADGLAALLLRIARDQSFVDQLSAAAYARAGQFSCGETARATLALYQRLAAG